ncbi:1-phosphofructokinase family hexose kinase [Mycolicibacterium sp. CR10]|uniref:1-phosphofructokinase family hexose kinase n=1 Tax=Mycolicibacterium sp. CR10 TaxID=2562314 RepID=UPI0010C13AE3|nr:1-phosphofructokinase family hexose kinase [Mycolicibacterium sp. CR10]
MLTPTIVTLTMNPALDIATGADVVRPTDKIRCAGSTYDPGGGGINVARTAQELGAPVSAIFPAGGHTGNLVTNLVHDARVPLRRISIAETTRESFTINERTTGMQYRFVLPGPRLTLDEQRQCLDELRLEAASAEFVVASGSLPPGVPPDWYQRVADICREVGTLLVLDTSGGGLTHVTNGVFLLKPSIRELRECSGSELATEAEQLAAARDLVDRGVAQAVVVSLGADGALLATAEHSQRFSAIPVHAVSGVGAGDAMVAAIVVAMSRGWTLTEAVRFGIACGTASLLTPGTGTCSREDVERFFELVGEAEDVDVAYT